MADAEIIVLGTRATNRFPAQAAFVNAALAWGKPVVAVALSDPYDALAYPTAPTVLATYGADPTMLDGARRGPQRCRRRRAGGCR